MTPDLAAAYDDLLDAALRAHAAGLCVLPPKEDGSKAPDASEWTSYQQQPSTEDQIRSWYANGRSGLGLVCGAVSQQLEVLEFEDDETYDSFKECAPGIGLADLVERIEAGYCETSPGGGIHWLYHCEQIEGNRKLAQRQTRPEERKQEHDLRRTLIETRGEGGFIVVAPTHGSVHETGKPYVLLSGSFETIATITTEERAALFDLARTFDSFPHDTERESRRRTKCPAQGGRPGDDFNARATWAKVLEQHGWVPLFRRGETDYWRRPGKTEGVSATTNRGGHDLLIVFSTSTPFEATSADRPRGYTKFAAFALLEHAGDFSSAARAIAAKGYGNGQEAAADGESNVSSVTNPWDYPVDFAASEYGPPVPLEAFPQVVAEYVAELAEVVQVPLGFVAGCAVGAVAAAATGRAEVRVGSSLVEPMNLYVGPTAESGERKRVLRELIFPIEEEERRLAEASKSEVARLRSQRKKLEARAAHLCKLAARAEGDEELRLTRELERLELEMPEVPALPRLLIDDATTEAVAKRLAEQKGRLCLISEEAGTFVEILLGKYREGVADLDVFLKAYDGGPIRVDRASRDTSAIIEKPALSILLTPQPTVLERMAKRAELRGRGLLARFVFILSPSLVGTRTFRDRAVNTARREAYAEALRAMLRLDGVQLAIRGEALEVWRQYADAMERAQADGGHLAGIRDWASKHPGRVARVAGLFHLAEHAAQGLVPEEISAETVAAAWAVGDWLEGHALAAFSRMGADRTAIAAKRVLEWIRRHQPERFTLRELHQHHRHVDRPQDLLPPLELLEGRGFLRREPEPEHRGRGRKPSPSFEVNPRMFDSRETSHKSQNQPPASSQAFSVNSVTSPLLPIRLTPLSDGDRARARRGRHG